MAVAVKPENASEAAAQSSPLDRLGVASLVGLAYVLGSIGVVFFAIPKLWAVMPAGALINTFVTGTLQVMVMQGAAVGLTLLGGKLVNFQPAHGLRAGIFVAGALVAGTCLTTWCVGAALEGILGNTPTMQVVGLTLMAVIAVAQLLLALRWFLRPATEDVLGRIEDQGWFTMAPYKKTQGLWVRRGTMVGVIAVAVCGIWTLHSHKTLAYGLPDSAASVPNTNYWFVRIPFTDGLGVPLLHDVRFTLPLLLGVATLWFSYRLVSWPAFADFLIATEAELNKVSWTTRKRLVQDTIVVLVTVVMFTVFLFFVDVLWGFLLSRVGVLRTSTDNLPTQSKELQPW